MCLRSFSAALLLWAGVARSAEVCDLTLTACPKQLPAGPVLVPMDVISLDARIPYCRETGTITNAVNASIMFVIDNSRSMNNNDPDEARFSVVTTLLDSIYRTHPSTKVGLSIFTNRLAFDSRDRGHFRPAFPGDSAQHDAYVPLTPLDSLFGDPFPRGVDTLKALLRHHDGMLVHNTARPSERGGEATGTDITLGFEAALQAMKASTSPKEAQFIIFLSDGLPSGVDPSRAARMMDFETGTNTPTTFTVYFTPGGVPIVPPRIETMTANIRANNYSLTNPRSAAFAINLPGAELQALLQTSVLNQILTVPTTGKGVAVSVEGKTLSTDTKGDSTHFLVASRMALNADLSTLQLKYTHTYSDTTTLPPTPRDTVFTYTLQVQRSPDAGPLPSIVTKTCREQAGLSLFSGGQALTTVNSSHADLEVRLQPSGGQACAGCRVEISLTGSADKENRLLAASGGSWNATIGRLESLTPTSGDGFLQHLASDSIVVTWTHPEIPLEKVRKSWPYQPLASALALYHDGKPIEAVTAHMAGLEVRLARPAGAPCDPCAVQIAPSLGADRETRPLVAAASGGGFNGTFGRIESISPIPGDGILQHVAGDSLVLTWVNPANPDDRVRRAYPYVAVAPALAVFHDGRELDTITSAHARLALRLTLPGGEPCQGCVVQASLSGSADKEDVPMAGPASPYGGTLARETVQPPGAANGRLEHLPGDSLIFVYVNPLNPAQQVRRSYPFVHFSNIAGITPQNPLAMTGSLPSPEGLHWVLSHAPGLLVQVQPGSGACCRVLATPADSRHPDSLRTVGIQIEASREFTLDVKVFSAFGEFVNRLAFTVPRSEFPKLAPVAGKDARSFRLLWNGRGLDGNLVGTGAYILKTTVALLPLPGITSAAPVATKIHRVGVLR